MSTIMQEFKNPGIDSRGMFRCWFPDAGADLRRVENHVNTIYTAGFGGMEIAMVPQFTRFDAREYGWATPRWKEMLRTILRTASALPEPFKIDLTITAHWPPALNTIDPNHPAAQKELSYTITKVTEEGTMELPMPRPRTCDDDHEDAAHFIFTDTFLCAVSAKIVGKKGKKFILSDFTDVSSAVTVLDRVTPAGIALDEDKFGPKPRLANVQHYYAIDLSAAGIPAQTGEAWDIGDTLLFAYYTRGTGQTLSGRSMPMFHLHLSMADKMYATDYYCTEGTDAIIDVWEKNILDDDEIRALMNRIGGAIFEDSIELSCSTIPWTNRFAEEFHSFRGYDIIPYLPILQSLKGSSVQFLTDSGIEKMLVDDYYTTLNDLYLRDHVERLKSWTKTFGCQYRAQSYGGDVNTSAASCVLDIAEGESLGFGEMREFFRNISGGVHMTGRKYVSDEVLADLMSGYCLDWKNAAGTLNSNWAAGVNRMVIHGVSYETEVSGQYNQWPGWHAFMNAFADPWGDRMPYWENVSTFAAFIARTQAILQGGTPRIDLAVYKGQRAYGYGYTHLMDYGYSYDIISNPHLLLDTATVSHGVFCPSGPCYQALLVIDQTMLPIPSAKNLLKLAQDGLNLLFVGQVPRYANGAFTVDREIGTLMAQMKALPTVHFCADLDDAVETLKKLGIEPRCSYNAPKLEPICRVDETGAYYFLYNGGENVTTTVRLQGQGKPVSINTWTGEIVPLACTPVEGGAELEVTICHRDGLMLAMVPDAEAPIGKTFGTPIAIPAFDTTIESWGPDPDAAVPTQSRKVTAAFGLQPVGQWDTLPASEALLRELDVDGMKHVSGRASYRAVFTLPSCSGAELTVETGDCMIVGGSINGHSLPPINQRSGRVDLGNFVHPGENEIELTMATTLINRLRIAHPLFDGKGGMPAPPQPAEGDPDSKELIIGTMPDDDYEMPGAPMDMPAPKSGEYHYGLLSAVVTPYSI